MSNKTQSLGKDALKLTTSKALVLVISMISGMLLSRFRTIQEYGTYSQLLMVINLITTIIMMGLPNSLNYFLANKDTNEERAEFLSVYYSLSTILSLLVGTVLIIITPILVSVFDNPMINSFIYFLAFFPWTKIICASIENILVIYKKTNYIIVYRILNSISLLGIIILVQIMEWTFEAYMGLYLGIEILFAVSVYVTVKKLAPLFRFQIDLSTIRTIVAFSIPIGLASMIGTLNVELDKFVIGTFAGTEELAIYTNASREMPVTIIATSITAVLLPQMARMIKRGSNDEAIELWGNATTISYAIISFLSFALVVFAPEVISFLYSEKYLPGVWVFRIYSIGLLLRCTYYGMILNATGKTKFILYSSLGSLATNLVLNFVLYFKLGSIGPAIATLIALCVIQGIQLLATCKVMNKKFKEIFPWMNLFKLTSLNLVIAIIFWIIKKYLMLEETLGNIGEAIVLGVIWSLVTCLLLKLIVEKDWRKVNSEK